VVRLRHVKLPLQTRHGPNLIASGKYRHHQARPGDGDMALHALYPT
jgi:hypothetical protein